MRVGRNDPCPCGSGKKYKKCCLRTDQEAEDARYRQEQAAQLAAEFPLPEGGPLLPPTPAPQQPPADPHVAALNARWEEFEKADYDRQVALFEQTLEENELMDDEMAFGMLEVLYRGSAERGQRERFAGWVGALRRRLPEVYKESAPSYLSWQITNALTLRKLDKLPRLAVRMARYAGRDVDRFVRVLDELAYHGELAGLREAMRRAWPRVKKAKDIVDWAVDEFAVRAGDYEIFAHLEQHPDPDPNDPALLEGLRFYVEDLKTEGVADYVDRVTGKKTTEVAGSGWEIASPRRKRRGRKKEEGPASDDRRRLYDLSQEFLGYLRRREGVPYAKGELARGALVVYLVERADGELKQQHSMLEMALPERKRPPLPRPGTPVHPLCPERVTLDVYLGRHFDLFAPRPHEAAALFELLPAWLRFLESRGGITAEQRDTVLADLRPMQQTLLEVVEQWAEDPAVPEALSTWGEPPAPREP